MFGVLIRFVPPSRLKAFGQTAQFLPIAIIAALSVVRRLPVPISIPEWISVFWPAQLFLFGHGIDRQAISVSVVVAAGAVLVLIIAGIQSLSVDYLVRVVRIVQGGSARTVKAHRSRVGEWVAQFSGGQQTRAGFEYVRCMMLRDWEFKRRAIVILPMMATPVSLVFRGTSTPFSEGFSLIHIMPHVFGFMLFWICTLLAYGGQEKSRWFFESLPEQAFHPFVRGVHLSLWLLLIGIPHAMIFPALVWLWGAPDAVLFACFSAATASLYLSCEVSLINGIPFTKKLAAGAGNLTTTLVLGAAIAAIAITVQHFLVFRSRAGVVIAITVLGLAARKFTRGSLNSFEDSIRKELRNPKLSNQLV